jgi:hypothetical protein
MKSPQLKIQVIDKPLFTTGEFMRALTCFTKADDISYPFNTLMVKPIMYFAEGVML